MKDHDTHIDYDAVREDYRFDGSIFSEEPERSALLKWIIDNRLAEPERRVIIQYAELQSFRKLAQVLGRSHTACARKVRRIRKKIIEEYSKLSKTQAK